MGSQIPMTREALKEKLYGAFKESTAKRGLDTFDWFTKTAGICPSADLIMDYYREYEVENEPLEVSKVVRAHHANPQAYCLVHSYQASKGKWSTEALIPVKAESAGDMLSIALTLTPKDNWIVSFLLVINESWVSEEPRMASHNNLVHIAISNFGGLKYWASPICQKPDGSTSVCLPFLVNKTVDERISSLINQNLIAFKARQNRAKGGEA